MTALVKKLIADDAGQDVGTLWSKAQSAIDDAAMS